jgi:hypothetical protein
MLGSSAWAQNQDNPKDLLLQVRRNALDTVRLLPRFVCTQTVERSRYEPANPEYGTGNKHRARSCDDTVAEAKRTAWKRRLSSSDRLRLDVAVSHGAPGLDGEMYSWAGEDRFGDQDIFEFVRDGAVSTGSFSAMLAAIFGNDIARFSYDGDRTAGARLLSEFGFRIPEDRSKYLYILGSGQDRQTPIGYEGSFLVDPATSDLVRLVVRAGQLPAETGTCELTQTVEYSRVHFSGADFLFPKEARVSAIHTDGSEAENRIQYSACHEYHAESAVRFERPKEESAPPPGGVVAAEPVVLPAGLPFKVVFTDRIDTASAAAGDRIGGKLKTAVRDRSSSMLVPEGTPVTARILKVRHFYRLSPSVTEGRRGEGQQPPLVVDIKLEALEIGGVARPFEAAFDSALRRSAKATTFVCAASKPWVARPAGRCRFRYGCGHLRVLGPEPYLRGEKRPGIQLGNTRAMRECKR